MDDATDKARVFFAVEVGAAARDAAAALAKRLAEEPGGDTVRWVRPEAYHVTLRFLGSVERERLGDLVELARRETAGCAPFTLSLGALSGLPSARRPRAVVVELEPEEPLAALAAGLERAAVAAGCKPERRRFRAHLTLGRARNPSRPRAPLLRGRCEAEPSPVDAFVLFESDTSPDGAKYTPLERIALGGSRSPHLHELDS